MSKSCLENLMDPKENGVDTLDRFNQYLINACEYTSFGNSDEVNSINEQYK